MLSLIASDHQSPLLTRTGSLSKNLTPLQTPEHMLPGGGPVLKRREEGLNPESPVTLKLIHHA